MKFPLGWNKSVETATEVASTLKRMGYAFIGILAMILTNKKGTL